MNSHRDNIHFIVLQQERMDDDCTVFSGIVWLHLSNFVIYFIMKTTTFIIVNINILTVFPICTLIFIHAFVLLSPHRTSGNRVVKWLIDAFHTPNLIGQYALKYLILLRDRLTIDELFDTKTNRKIDWEKKLTAENGSKFYIILHISMHEILDEWVIEAHKHKIYSQNWVYGFDQQSKEAKKWTVNRICWICGVNSTLHFNPKYHNICINLHNTACATDWVIGYECQSFQYPINRICRDSSWTNGIRATRQNKTDLLFIGLLCLFNHHFRNINASTIIPWYWMHSKIFTIVQMFLLPSIGIFFFLHFFFFHSIDISRCHLLKVFKRSHLPIEHAQNS